MVTAFLSMQFVSHSETSGGGFAFLFKQLGKSWLCTVQTQDSEEKKGIMDVGGGWRPGAAGNPHSCTQGLFIATLENKQRSKS